MPYKATVIPVMIASPSDVSEECEVIRDAIHTWNNTHSARAKVVLMATAWDTHGSPELGARAQDLINRRILEDCDLLIGVFSTRLGTPTGKFDSGTVEEIEKHVKAGKPAMIYFSKEDIERESFDTEQYTALKAFKDRCKKQGVVAEFHDLRDLEDKVSRQLQISLNKIPYLQEILKSSATDTGELGPSAGESSASRQNISEDAQHLLKAAAKRDDGIILMISFSGGRVVQAGGESFGGKRGRDSAKWEGALNELLSRDLVVARGEKGEVYELTDTGWALADKLNKESSL